MEYPIDSQSDKILYQIEVGGKKAVIFQGGKAIEKMRAIYQVYNLRKIFLNSEGSH